MDETTIYEQIALRTQGNVYIGVVGPVRTGKSTFIRRLMELLVLPNLENPSRRERARDELPQSGSGRTIMTSEPKFVPEEAVEISPDGKCRLSIRLIDSVGYLIPGAAGAEENGEERMISTPWSETPIPMTAAAEQGTERVIREHCTLGIVMTTDGTICGIPREDYVEAEGRAILDMQKTGKPFLVVINSQDPGGVEAQALWSELEQRYGVNCAVMNVLTMQEQEIQGLLTAALYEFPLRELRFFLPGWLEALEPEHPLKKTLYDALRKMAGECQRIAQAEPSIRALEELESVSAVQFGPVDLGTGTVSCTVSSPEALFYQILAERSGLEIRSQKDLVRYLSEMAAMRKEYEQVADALEQVRATGYGIVLPTPEQMQLKTPEIVKRGGSYAVRLQASAPSIHMMRADIQTEISPMVGDERQSQELVHYLLSEYEEDPEKIWQTNLFGKSLYELVSEGLSGKLQRLPDSVRLKFQSALSKMVNESAGRLICIIW